MTRSTALAGLALALFGCGSGSDGEGGSIAIPDRPLSGEIGGAPWEALAGRAEPAHNRTDVLFATFQAEVTTTCSKGLSIPYVHAYLPLTPGTYNLSTDLPGSFTANNPSSGDLTIYLTFTGKVTIDSVDETKITGGLALVRDDEPGFDVGGTFSADRCPD